MIVIGIIEPSVAFLAIIVAFSSVVLMVMLPARIVTLVPETLASPTISVTFVNVSFVLATANFSKTTRAVSSIQVSFTVPFMTAVPAEVEEVKVIVAIPLTFVSAKDGYIVPSVVEKLTWAPFTPLPSSSVTLAVIVV
ncbi:MAG: hypothetical protein C5S38_02190 [Candidatus Methanophagaceae archaeon]|nr:MAG: hypothetical protein C5S38_02190 [Methanophagales archaeon]